MRIYEIVLTILKFLLCFTSDPSLKHLKHFPSCLHVSNSSFLILTLPTIDFFPDIDWSIPPHP